MNRLRRLVLGLALVGAAALAGCASGGVSSHGVSSHGVLSHGVSSHGADPSATASGLSDQTGSGPYHGIGLETALPRPSFTLQDPAGRTFDFSARTRGHPTLLFFGYTDCPDICPATMADISMALKKVPVALQRRTYVVFVSTDVKHDTGPVVSRWLAKFSVGGRARFVGLRGSQNQVDAAQAAAHVFLAEDGGRQHSAQVLLYGADDYARVSFAYNNTGEQDQIEHDLPLVAG